MSTMEVFKKGRFFFKGSNDASMIDHRNEDNVPTDKVGVTDVCRRKESMQKHLGAFWIPVS